MTVLMAEAAELQEMPEGFGTIILIAVLVGLLPFIFYLLTLQKALGRVSEQNRAMAPGMVWLLFIPLFSLVWHFFVVINMAKSLGAEFAARDMEVDPDPGKSLGMAMCILGACSIIPFLGGLAGIGFLVCWIIYWVKIAGYSGRLAAA